MMKYPLHQSEKEPLGQDVSAVVLMAAFEFTDELLNSEWIESGIDINSLPVDTIFKNILIKLH